MRNKRCHRQPKRYFCVFCSWRLVWRGSIRNRFPAHFQVQNVQEIQIVSAGDSSNCQIQKYLFFFCWQSSIARVSAWVSVWVFLFVIIYRFYGCPSCSAVGSTTIRQILLSASWLLIWFTLHHHHHHHQLQSLRQQLH